MVLLCLCFCAFICGVCFVIICSPFLLILVPREGWTVNVAFPEYFHVCLRTIVKPSYDYRYTCGCVELETFLGCQPLSPSPTLIQESFLKNIYFKLIAKFLDKR